MSTCVFTFSVEVPMKSCHEDTLSSLYFDTVTGICKLSGAYIKCCWEIYRESTMHCCFKVGNTFYHEITDR